MRASQEILGFVVTTAHTSEGKQAAYIVKNMLNVPLLSMGEGVMNILGLVVHHAVAENQVFLIEEPENDIELQRALDATSAHIAHLQSDFENLTRLLGQLESEVVDTVSQRRDAIPKSVQHEVWRRDQGRCVLCGSQERLHFDHIIPASRGGASTARNVQLLCERCNLTKSDTI